MKIVYCKGWVEEIIFKEWWKGIVGDFEVWIYYVKGLWVIMFGDVNFLVSIIGSLNYIKWSYLFDLEVGVLIVI